MKKKKCLSVFLAFALIISLMPALALQVKAVIAPSTSLNVVNMNTTYNSAEIEPNPMAITSAADLVYMAQQVNADGDISYSDSSGSHTTAARSAAYRMTANISLNDNTSSYASWGTTPPAYTWTPIGNSTKPFTGNFSGSNYMVSGIYINNTSVMDLGLFGCVSAGTIQYVDIKESYIRGGINVGGIAGECVGSGTVRYCHNQGIVIGVNNCIGGIAGYSAALVRECINAGTVTGEGNANIVGGIVGNNDSFTTQYCYNMGSVSGAFSVGGIAGTNLNIIEDCYNVGSVTGTSSHTGIGAIGGITGAVNAESASVKDCYNAGAVADSAASSGLGGIVGYTVQGTVTGCYYDKQMCAAKGINGADVSGSAEGKLTSELTTNTVFPGWDSSIWSFYSGQYPYLDLGPSDVEDAAAHISRTPINLAASDTVASVHSNFTLGTASNLTWTSSDSGIVTISGGNATVLSSGSVTLTASLNGMSKSVVLGTNYAPATTYSVSGTVSAGSTGASVTGRTVTLYASTDTTYAHPLYTGTTGSDGSYTISGVTAGTYVAIVAASDQNAQSVSSQFTVAADYSGVSVSLVPTMDYRVTGGPGAGSFKVNGSGSYDTLASALAVCTNAGSDGVLLIQLGSGSLSPLKITEEATRYVSANKLISATYTGYVEIQDDTSSTCFSDTVGLAIPDNVQAVFNGLVLTNSTYTGNTLHSTYLSGSGALDINGSTSITNDVSDGSCITNVGTGTVNINSGTLLSTYYGGGYNRSYCIRNSSGAINISGGTITDTSPVSLCVFSNGGAISASGGVINARGLSGIGIINYGDVNISNTAAISSAYMGVDMRGGTLSFSGGTIESSGKNGVGIDLDSNSTCLNMTGGTARCTDTSNTGATIALINFGTANISGGALSCAGTYKSAYGGGSTAIYQMGNASHLKISDSANITSALLGIYNRGTLTTGSGSLEITGGTITSTGASGAVLCLDSSNASSKTTVSGGKLVSASDNTILLAKVLNSSTDESLSLFGKTVHGSPDAALSIKGAVSGDEKVISAADFPSGALNVQNYSAGKAFKAWISDANTEISTQSSETFSNLTTGTNASVTDIYLKTADIPATVTLASSSLGTAGDGSITGLTAGTKYKVTLGSQVYYSKADGTLSTNASDCAALTGTAITGLVNGSTYLVEEYSTGGGTGGSSYVPPTSNGANVDVGGKTQTAGKTETSTTDGKKATTVSLSHDDISKILEGASTGATVTIPITTGSDTVSGRLDGQAVKDMDQKAATLVVTTDQASYVLPASQIGIDAIADKLGVGASLSNITVSVSISEPSDTAAKVVKDAASSGGYTIAVPPVEFTVNCSYGGKTVEVSSFSSYVERMIAIPDGVDASKITTAVVVEPNGSTHHVPTEVTVINGKYFAKINSLTNSVYSVIYNPVAFSDVTNHWAKDAINDMGSRLVVSGVGDNSYAPDRSITRAEFAAIMVRALGLEPGTGTNSFNDVTSTDWFNGYVGTAVSYGIVKGYDSGSFGPNDLITREQAMTMIARAMKVTGLKADLTDNEVSTLLSAYSDVAFSESYAQAGIAACIKTGIANGTSGDTISPKDNVTRAEVAVMAKRLLQKSGLI